VFSVSVVEEFSLKPERLLKQLLELPSVLFNPHRIGIMVELYHAGAADFPQLAHDLGITPGALATHLKALASERLVESKREQVESRVRTTFIITAKGLSAIEQMFSNLREISREFPR